ncbi:tRNA dimethylallyltransferase [Cucumispora dikerogammari]|nr:tRNA dimethylallyltransferase [Cucumispora dikerogammari]
MHLFITGSTGTGKTSLANKLYDLLTTDNQKVIIISCDSVQIYKHLNIGTNKDKKTHLGMDLVNLNEKFDVEQYISYVRAIVFDDNQSNRTIAQPPLSAALSSPKMTNQLHPDISRAGLEVTEGQVLSRSHLPIPIYIIVGGTTFYIQRYIATLSDTEHPTALIHLHHTNRQTHYKQTDLRCEKMILKNLLNECVTYYSFLMDNENSLNIINSIGYRDGKEFVKCVKQGIELYELKTCFLDSGCKEVNCPTHNTVNIINDIPAELITSLIPRFYTFLNTFKRRTRNYIRKQISYFNTFYLKHSESLPILIVSDYNMNENDINNNKLIINNIISFINNPLKYKSISNEIMSNKINNNFKLMKEYKSSTVLLKEDVVFNLIRDLIKFIICYRS